MVAGDGIGDEAGEYLVVDGGRRQNPLGQQVSPGRRMVDLRGIAFQARLKAAAVLANVVQLTGQPRQFLTAEDSREAGREVSRGDQMVLQRMPGQAFGRRVCIVRTLGQCDLPCRAGSGLTPTAQGSPFLFA
ncbi:MAG: hypothetical protein Kilf2KO_09800 [Rhodospirillales bacterium]